MIEVDGDTISTMQLGNVVEYNKFCKQKSLFKDEPMALRSDLGFGVQHGYFLLTANPSLLQQSLQLFI